RGALLRLRGSRVERGRCCVRLPSSTRNLPSLDGRLPRQVRAVLANTNGAHSIKGRTTKARAPRWPPETGTVSRAQGNAAKRRRSLETTTRQRSHTEAKIGRAHV